MSTMARVVAKVSHSESETAIRQNEKISVFRVTGLKNLGWVGTHIFCNYKKKL